MTGSMLGIILPYSDHFLENWPVGRTYYKLMLVNQPVYVYKILLLLILLYLLTVNK